MERLQTARRTGGFTKILFGRERLDTSSSAYMTKSLAVVDRASGAFVPALREHSHFATKQRIFGPYDA